MRSHKSLKLRKKITSLTNPTEIKKNYEGILQTYVNKLDNSEEMMNS